MVSVQWEKVEGDKRRKNNNKNAWDGDGVGEERFSPCFISALKTIKCTVKFQRTLSASQD